jgi:threonine dehydrogenase-like Zn-dependent dehydrogenase
MSRTSRAAVMTGPGKIEVREYPLPELVPGSMLMKMELSGICGTDKHTYKGETTQAAGTLTETNVPFPIIPGHENVGIVAEITREARTKLEFDGQTLKEGDRVTMAPDVICGTCWSCRNIHAYPWCENNWCYGTTRSCAEAPHLFGGWSDYMYIAPEVFVYKVPEGLSPEAAVLTELMACSFNLDKAKEFSSLASEGFVSGDTVVIQGVGPLGFVHLIKSQLLGAGRVIAIDRSQYRLDMAKRFGADVTFNAQHTTSEERIEEVKALTGGRGADLVVECIGRPEPVVEGLEMLRQGGMYIETGNFVETGTVQLSVHRHLCAKNVRLIGITNHPSTGYRPSLMQMQKYGHIYPFEQVVTHRYSLGQAADALNVSMSDNCMKVCIAPSD